MSGEGEHDHVPASACNRRCPAYGGMLMEKTAARFHTTQTQNDRGEWVPAIPLPLFLNFGRVQCDDCGHRSFGQRRYREHFALAHVLGLP
jgi:hypothetical protein